MLCTLDFGSPKHSLSMLNIGDSSQGGVVQQTRNLARLVVLPNNRPTLVDYLPHTSTYWPVSRDIPGRFVRAPKSSLAGVGSAQHIRCRLQWLSHFCNKDCKDCPGASKSR